MGEVGKAITAAVHTCTCINVYMYMCTLTMCNCTYCTCIYMYVRVNLSTIRLIRCLLPWCFNTTI